MDVVKEIRFKPKAFLGKQYFFLDAMLAENPDVFVDAQATRRWFMPWANKLFPKDLRVVSRDAHWTIIPHSLQKRRQILSKEHFSVSWF